MKQEVRRMRRRFRSSVRRGAMGRTFHRCASGKRPREGRTRSLQVHGPSLVSSKQVTGQRQRKRVAAGGRERWCRVCSVRAAVLRPTRRRRGTLGRDPRRRQAEGTEHAYSSAGAFEAALVRRGGCQRVTFRAT